MRKLTAGDVWGSLVVAAIVVPFVGYSVRGSMPFVQDPRGMAALGLVGALVAFAAFGRRAFGDGSFRVITVALAVGTVGFAVAALIAETSWVLLVPMMVGLVAFWALALAHDAGYLGAGRAHA